jgi:hypothetical protein
MDTPELSQSASASLRAHFQEVLECAEETHTEVRRLLELEEGVVADEYRQEADDALAALKERHDGVIHELDNLEDVDVDIAEERASTLWQTEIKAQELRLDVLYDLQEDIQAQQLESASESPAVTHPGDDGVS